MTGETVKRTLNGEAVKILWWLLATVTGVLITGTSFWVAGITGKINSVEAAQVVGSEHIARLEETFKGVAEVGFRPEQAFFATPYPGTALYQYSVEKGYITDEAAFLQKLSDHEQGSYPIVNFTDLPDEVLMAAKKKVESFPV